MAFQYLPTEIVLKIFRHLPSMEAVNNLACASRRFHEILPPPRKTEVLFIAAERAMGPLEDAIQVLTMNENEPLHVQRKPPLSLALLKSITQLGNVALKYEESIYPQFRWDLDPTSRRSLTGVERFRLRRAIYRYWLYAKAFHNPKFPRESRLDSLALHKRFQLLRSWSTNELLEIEEVRIMFQTILATDLCPSDGACWLRRSEEIHQSCNYESSRSLLHRNAEVFGLFHQHYGQSEHQSSNAPAWELREHNMEAWGDDIHHYYVVQSMLKLDPEQIMWLYENVVFKHQLEAFVQDLGYWFAENGETLLHTLVLVLQSRGLDFCAVQDGITEGLYGICFRG